MLSSLPFLLVLAALLGSCSDDPTDAGSADLGRDPSHLRRDARLSEGEPCRGIEVQPAFIDFGRTRIGTTRFRNITVSNPACDPARVARISLDEGAAPAFSLVEIPSQLVEEDGQTIMRPGDTLTASVSYTPSSTATDQGSVLVEGIGASFAVSAEGEGYQDEPPITPGAEAETGLWIAVAWDTTGDVDLHLLHPEGSHFEDEPWVCFWRNQDPDWGVVGDSGDDPSLTAQVTDGSGPETIHYPQPPSNTSRPDVYGIGVKYYADHGSGAAGAEVYVFFDGVEVGSFSARDLQPREFWDVARVEWPSRLIWAVDHRYPAGIP